MNQAGRGTRLGLIVLWAAGILLPSAITWADSFSGVGDFPAGGVQNSQTNAISATGSFAAGYGWSQNGQEAFRWTAAGGLVGLGDLPGGNSYSLANAISADASTVVGQSISDTGYQAFRWSAGVMTPVALPGYTYTYSDASA